MDTEELEKYKKTLMECSMDDNEVPVTLKENKVYKFDDISEFEGAKYRLGKKMHSADALYIKEDGSAYLFEFKNERKNRMPWKSVRLKAHDSIITLQIIFNPGISLAEWASKTTYFVIYNDGKVKQKENQSMHFDKFKEAIKVLAKEESKYPILWGMELYEEIFYKKVYTIDVKDFENQFFPQIFGG